MDLTFKEAKMDDEKYPIILPLEDTLAIINQLNADAWALYYYLHSKGMRWKWNDDTIANDLGWKVRKVQEYKRRLKDAGWIDYWTDRGSKYMYLGKKMVAQSKKDYRDR